MDALTSGNPPNLDVPLSTRASEVTVAAILAQLDVALSTRASEVTLVAILAKLDTPADPVTVDVVDRAARLLGIVYGSQGQQLLQRAATFDLIVQLRHAGVEVDPTDISDDWTRQLGGVDVVRWGGTALTGRDISGDLRALTDDAIKGLLRSLGDAGAAPTNQTGETVLKKLHDIETFLDELTDALGSVATDTIRVVSV